MKGFVLGLLFGVMVMACATPEAPKRSYTVKIYSAYSDTSTIERKNDDGSIEVISTKDELFDQYVCMTPEDYAKERKYQEELKKSCLQWR